MNCKEILERQLEILENCQKESSSNPEIVAQLSRQIVITLDVYCRLVGNSDNQE